ncbi:MAG TPA: helix-turn-helix transcriptional regulator [Thermoanaerobaculia bacterium]|nr:helix-turn-helix transcriptional regulator [Thermoanaerobaculia bacterium]
MTAQSRIDPDEALKSAFRRLPIAVVVLDSERSLRPFNEKATEFFEREGLSSTLLSLRPSHPLSKMLLRLIASEEALGTEVVEFPSGAIYTIEPSKRSSKGRDRWIILLIEPAEEQPAPEHSDLSGWGFTAREEDVMRLLLSGSTTKAISERLAIAENTLRTHIKRLFEKTGARTRTELMARVLRRKK